MGQRKNQWHPAFAAAMRMELMNNGDDLIFEDEHLLSKKPLQIDILIIKKHSNIELQNSIGKIFRIHNIVEYKSPQDSMGIDAFYKATGYASLYKVSSKKENLYNAEDITITLVRQRYPAKLIKHLRANQCNVEKVYPGIYYVTGNVLFATQILVSKDLGTEEHIWLHSLSNQISKDTYHELLDSIDQLDERQKELYGNAVLQVVTTANKKEIEKWKEESNMCEALAEIMAPEIEVWKQEARSEGLAEGRAEGRVQGRAEGRAEGQILAYADLGLTIEEIANKLSLSTQQIEEILSKEN